MKKIYNQLIYKLFPDAYPKYEVSTDELGEQPILSPDDWKVLVTSAPPKIARIKTPKGLDLQHTA